MKRIEGFENYIVKRDGTIINKETGLVKIATSNHSGKGYYYVDLYNKGKRKRFYIHRLVATYFIPNPLNKPYVNHIDGNPSNNNVENLEWCTPSENVHHAAKIIKAMTQYEVANNKRKKAIQGTNVVTGEKTKVFKSIRLAEKQLGIPASNIVANLKGRQSHTKNITWKYV